MSAKTLFSVVFLTVIVVVGVLFFYHQFCKDTEGGGASIHQMIKGLSEELDIRKTSSGLTEVDYQSTYFSKVDWEKGVVQVGALGSKNPEEVGGYDYALIQAEKISQMRALEKLVAFTKSLRYSSNTQLVNEIDLTSQAWLSVEGEIKGAFPIKSIVMKSPEGWPRVLTVYEYYFKGNQRFNELILPKVGGEVQVQEEIPEEEVPEEVIVEEKEAAPEVAVEVGFAKSVIIDASGLEVMPALLPKIWDNTGRLIYDASRASRDAVQEHGVVTYRTSVARARQLDWIGDDALVVKAVAVKGSYKADLVISHQDAEKIMALDAETHFMRDAAVAVVMELKK